MTEPLDDARPAAPPARRGRRPGWVSVLLAGIAPGALAGAQLAGLIFFLNPGLPFQPVPVARGILIYGGLLGLVSLLVHLPFTWRRTRRARRWLPWSLTIALTVAATLDSTHASYYAWYLPTGMNDRLIRTSLWLALAALIFFYTALLHTLHRRPYGIRSRVGLTLLTLLSVYAMLERREAFRPRPAPGGRAAAVEDRPRPRLLVVGLDSATLDAVLPLAGQGGLPFLDMVLRGGAYGRLEALSPPHRDALWMSLATGKHPAEHGVTGTRLYPSDWIAPGSVLQLLPRSIQFGEWGLFGSAPSTPRVYDRQALALWEILPRLGQPSGVIGWPAAAPSIDPEFALSDRFFVGEPEPRSVRPADLAERARLYRQAPQDLDPDLRRRLGSGAPPLLQAAAADAWRQAVLLGSLEEHPEASAVFVAFPGLREVSRQAFGGFAAVQFDGVRDPASVAAAERVAAYYGMLDRFLAELWAREEGRGPRVLVVVSPAGVERRGGGLWSGLRGGGPEVGGTLEEASDGVLALYGEGIRPGALLTGARLVDVAPTVLYALGIPVARDLDGQVLTAAFDRAFLASHPLTFFPSYESLQPRGR
jgi:Type I phosphodiesterase / nucleotide pyrophosphatase